MPEHINAINRIQVSSAIDGPDKIKCYENLIAQYQVAYATLLQPLAVTLITDVKGLVVYDIEGHLFTKDKEFVVDPFVTYNFIAKAEGYDDLRFSIGPLKPKSNLVTHSIEINMLRFVYGCDRSASSYLILDNGFVYNSYANGDEIVVDPKTRVMWIKSPHSLGEIEGQINLKQANTFCTALSYGGYKDWRLPSLAELSSVRRFLTPFIVNIQSGSWLDGGGYWSSGADKKHMRLSDGKSWKTVGAFYQKNYLWPCRTFQN